MKKPRLPDVLIGPHVEWARDTRSVRDALPHPFRARRPPLTTWDMIRAAIRATGHYLPPDVYRRGQRRARQCRVTREKTVLVAARRPRGVQAALISWLVRHQASRRIIEAVAKRPGGQFTYGDRLVLSAFGAGFTPGSFCFPWAIA